VPEAAKARGRKGADSQKQNLKVRGVHSVFTAQRYQKWLKTGVVARPKQIDLLHPKEMVKKNGLSKFISVENFFLKLLLGKLDLFVN
jgi:hypothetical protein